MNLYKSVVTSMTETRHYNEDVFSNNNTISLEQFHELECTHGVRTHAVLLLLVTPPSEWQWSAVVIAYSIGIAT